MEKIETRGGSRIGAGRKSQSPEKKRVQVSLSVSPKTKERIQEMRGKNMKVGTIIDELIRQYFEDEK